MVLNFCVQSPSRTVLILCVCVYTNIYTHTYIERENEREGEKRREGGEKYTSMTTKIIVSLLKAISIFIHEETTVMLT